MTGEAGAGFHPGQSPLKFHLHREQGHDYVYRGQAAECTGQVSRQRRHRAPWRKETGERTFLDSRWKPCQGTGCFGCRLMSKSIPEGPLGCPQGLLDQCALNHAVGQHSKARSKHLRLCSLFWDTVVSCERQRRDTSVHRIRYKVSLVSRRAPGLHFSIPCFLNRKV